jgi:hypothetical protein
MADRACRDVRIELGAYLLGALGAEDRARVARHLETCAACRGELAELAPLPGLLARVPRDAVAETAAADGGRADAALAQVARLRRHRRTGVALVAACLVVLAGAFGVGRAVQDAGHTASTVLTATSTHTPVSGHASLAATGEGTRVVVGLTGVRPGTRCELVVISFGGRREIAATWRANYEGDATVVGASALAPRQIHRLIVAGATGVALAQFVQVPPRRAARTTA